MKKHQLWLLGVMVWFLNLIAGTTLAQTVTFDSLLDEMVNRSVLADFPSPAYTCQQVSSYDRNSIAPDKPGWFDNNDRSNFLRMEKRGDREEWVMMDVKGPGAIVRWWVTSGAYLGTIRIYLDKAADPVVETRIDQLVGGTALVGAPLSEERARGRSLYLPIPYAKSCKVTFSRPQFPKHLPEMGKRNDLPYYQINYRTYAPDTQVESFSRSTIANSKRKIEVVQKQLLDPTSAMPKQTEKVAEDTMVCKPKQSVAFHEVEGSGAICKVSIKLDAKDQVQAYRSIILKATFDNEKTVWCPVGDFFGSGIGINPFKDWYRQVEKDGTMTCWWIMPYKKACLLEAENVGEQPVTIKATIETCPWKWTDRSMHFCTTWRQESNIQTRGNRNTETINAIDWNYLCVKGKGVFVGDSLVLLNKDYDWWGEGDEKIYVDGEKFPSHFGTGTEDYYGYAWCTPKFFESPFHSQPRAEGPSNYGNITNSRVRLLDGIPFTKSYCMDMEIWNWAATTMNYAVATHWYALPGAKANHSPQPAEAALPVKYYSTPYTFESFQLKTRPSGYLEIQRLLYLGQLVDGWDKKDHFRWSHVKPGAQITFTILAKSAGKQKLVVNLTKSFDYAIIQFYLDGKKIGKPIDLYSPQICPTGPLTLGTFDLNQGEHDLTAEIIGANPKATKVHPESEYLRVGRY